MAKAKRVCPIKGSGGGSAEGAVSYAEEQSLTKIQKDRARGNIGAVSQEELSGKANNDGYYSKMTVGAAESLVGGNETSREFTRDTAGGTADIADGIEKIERIKGNTIVWNNKPFSFSSLVTEEEPVNGSRVVKLSNYSLQVIVEQGAEVTNRTIALFTGTIDWLGHYYYIRFFDKQVSGLGFKSSYSPMSRPRCEGTPAIIKSSTNGGQTYRLSIPDNLPVGVYTAKLVIIDLTKMFGAGNEPATVAEFEKMFPLDYYNYNAGQLLNLNPTGILTDGFNQYNHASPVINVFPLQYYIGGTYTSIWFSKNADDEEGTEITPVDHLFTPSEYGYIHVEGGNATDTVVNLHWSGKRDGEYEPYWSGTRNIDISAIKDSEGNTLFPDGLCNVGSIHDEVTSTNAIKRIGKQTITGAIGDAITLTGCKTTATEYLAVGDYGTLANGVLTLTVAVTAKDVYFELATPIEVTFAEPLNLTYRVSDYGTETLLPQNGAVPTTAPIKMDVIYGLNVVDFVRNAGKNFVTIEDSTSVYGSTFTNLRSALSTAFGIDIVPTYDSTNKRYTFVISDNRKVEVPESATSSGTKGTWAEDATSVYFCTDTNTWVKINKETW